MQNFSIKQTPIFIPKLTGQESAFVDLNLEYPAFLMDAHINALSTGPAKKIAKACKTFIIDPVTNYLVEPAYQQKKSFRKLPYTPREPFKVEELFKNELSRTEKLVNPAIDYQLSQDVGIVMLPYLFAESHNNIKFGINLNMISDGIKYARHKKIEKPLFAMINIGSAVLDDPGILNYIVGRYDDDFGDNVRGYFIILDRFYNNAASYESLQGLAHLVFQLSKNKEVFVLRIGAFGEILSAVGASGFSSGLARGESFCEEVLRKEPGGYGRPISRWTYLPELFNHINDEEVKRISYECRCPACGGSMPRGVYSKKAHFLYRRMETMKLLDSLDRAKRINLMENRLEEAIRLAATYNRRYTLSLQTKHLINWRNVLQLAKYWTHEENQNQKSVDVDKLIHEARVKRKK